MKTIVTTDGSAHSLRVLPHAWRISVALGLDCLLLRVLERGDDRGEIELSLESMLHDHDLAGEHIAVERGDGESVADAILRAAEQEGAALVAMDSRGAGALRHAVLGSVAMDVLGHSQLPVLVTGGSLRREPGAGRLRLLMTSDGSEDSRAILRTFGPLLTGMHYLRLLQFYVPRLGDEGEPAELRRCQANLENWAAALPESLDVTARADVVHEREKTQAAIIRVAEGEDVDVIAMATHGHTARRHALLGSVALAVLGDSPVPVILARSD